MTSEPPNDPLAERSTLGACLISRQAIGEVLRECQPSDFYQPKHEAIADAIKTLFVRGDAVDAVTVAAELGARKLLAKVGGGVYLHELASTVPSAVNASSYAKIVAEKSRLRGLADLGARLQALAHTDSTEADALFGQAEAFIREAGRPSSRGLGFSDLVDKWRTWQDTDGGVIPTPWPEVNTLLPGGGCRPGTLTVVGGRPGASKSNILLNMALEAAEQGFKSTVFSVEMEDVEVASRVLAAATWSPFSQIIGKRMEKETWERVEEYISDHRDLPLEVVDEAYVTVEKVVSHCRAKRPKLLCVDYAQLIQPTNSKASREQQVAHVTRTLKVAAKNLQMSVWVAAQLNRGPEKDNRLPTMADLRESGAAEQDADLVLLLHRPPGDEGIVKLITAKNRNGKTGITDLVFRGNLARVG